MVAGFSARLRVESPTARRYTSVKGERGIVRPASSEVRLRQTKALVFASKASGFLGRQRSFSVSILEVHPNSPISPIASWRT